MTDLRTAAQQALEALEASGCLAFKNIMCRCSELCGSYTAAQNLRAALAQQDEPLNLTDPAVRKRLATQWGYVPAAQAEPVEPVATLIAQRNDILRMAREAGLPFGQRGAIPLWDKELARFAELVAAAKDAEHQQTLALQQRSYEREIQLEVEAEREECAQIAESTVCDTHLPTGVRIYGTQVAAAIRARTP